MIRGAWLLDRLVIEVICVCGEAATIVWPDPLISSSPFKDIMKRNDTPWMGGWLRWCVWGVAATIHNHWSADSTLPVDSHVLIPNVMQVKELHNSVFEFCEVWDGILRSAHLINFTISSNGRRSSLCHSLLGIQKNLKDKVSVQISTFGMLQPRSLGIRQHSLRRWSNNIPSDAVSVASDPLLGLFWWGCTATAFEPSSDSRAMQPPNMGG